MLDFLAGVPGKLKTLIDRLTSTRAANLDNLDAAISTRAAASTALSTATWTATKAGYLDMAISGVARIKSIQQVNSSASTGVSSGTWSGSITVTTVDVTKTIFVWTGETPPDETYYGTKIVLTNATTMTCSGRRTGSANTSVAISGFLVEFY